MSPKKYAQRLESLFTEATPPEPAETPAPAPADLFARFFELAADGFVVINAQGLVTHANAAFARLTGLTGPAVIGQPFVDLFHPEDHPDPAGWQASQAVYAFTARTRTAAGGWLRLDWDAHTDPAGQGYLTARPAHDREALDTLTRLGSDMGVSALETMRLLQRAIEAGDESVSIADMRQPDAPLVYVNQAFERTTGYTAAEVVGKNCRFLQGTDRDQPALAELRAALREGRPCTVTLRNYRKDGSLFYNRLDMSPVRDEHGVVTHFLGLQNDVTAELRARQELERRNRELHAINTIAQAVAAHADLHHLLDIAGQTMMDLFKVSGGYIALYDAQTHQVDIPFYMDEGQRYTIPAGPVGRGLTSIVIQRREPLLIAQLDEATFTRLGAVRIQTTGQGLPQSWLGVPIFSGEQVIGVLNVQDMPPNRFDADDVRLLATLAAALGSAIQNTRLAQEAQLYTDVMVNTPIGLYVWHLEDPADPASLRLVIANPASQAATGLAPADVVGKTMPEAFPNLIGTRIPELYAGIAQGGAPVHLGEVVYEDERIGKSVFDVRAFPLPGRRVGVSFENITLSKQAAEEFARLSAQQRAILENAGYAVIGTDAEGLVTLFNPAAEQLLGYSAAEVVGRHTLALWHDPAEVQARAAQLTAELGQPVPAGFETFVVKTRLGRPNDFEWTFIRKDGRRVPVLLNISAMRDAQGQITGFVGIAADQTERKQAEQALRESEQRLVKLASAAPGMIFQFVLRPDNTSYFPFTSRWALDVLGVDPADLARDATPILRLIHPEDVPGFQAAVAHSAQTLTRFEWEGRVQRPDGVYMDVQVRSQPEPFAEGGVLWNGILTDISALKQAEQALHESEQRFRALADSTREGVVIHDEGVIVEANAAISELFGYTPEEIRGRNLMEFITPATRPLVLEKVRSGYLGTYEAEGIRKDGTVFPVQAAGRPVPYGGKMMRGGIIRDLTERKRAEAALREAEERLRLVVEHTGQMIYDYNVASDTLQWGGAIQALTQFTPAEFAEVNLKRWEEMIHPDDRPAAKRVFDQAMADVGEYRVEYRFARKDGSYFYVSDYGSFLPGLDGTAARMVGAMSDITERKRAEAASARRARDLARVADISAAVIANQEVQAVAETAAHLTQRAFGLYHCHIFLFDEATEILGITACGWEEGDPREGTHGTARIPLRQEQSLVALAARTGQAVMSNDTQNDPRFFPNALLPRTRAEIAVPMLASGRLVGVFDVQADKTHAFDDTDQFIYTTLAAQVAASIQEARFFAEVSRRAAEMETVARVSTAIAATLDPQALLQDVVNLTKQAFNLYHAHIYLLNDSGDKLVLTAGAGEVGRQMVAQGRVIAIESPRSLVARAARTREGVIRNDARSDPNFLPHPLLPETRSELAVPMIVGDELIGVFDVQADIVNRFNPDDVRVQTTLAAQVAVALQNARRYQTARQRAERERLINEIAQKIQTTATVSGALEVAAHELARVTRAQQVSAELRPAHPVAGD